jgi:hypothetical protein
MFYGKGRAAPLLSAGRGSLVGSLRSALIRGNPRRKDFLARSATTVSNRIVHEPEISRFFGIERRTQVARGITLFVQMYWDDHEPPHFHVRYAGQKALIAIEGPYLLKGRLSPRVLGLVTEWGCNTSCRFDGRLGVGWGRGGIKSSCTFGVKIHAARHCRSELARWLSAASTL